MNSTLIDAIIEEKRPPNKFLSEMKMVIPWQKIREVLKKEIVRSGRGRPSYDLILMFKMLLVKTWYNLSDEGTEFQIRDRLSFKEFCELNMMDKVPDASCLEDFRHMIEKHELMSKLLDLVNEQCEEKGLLLRIRLSSIHTSILVAQSLEYADRLKVIESPLLAYLLSEFPVF
jgi:IS5 family transposase